MVPLIKRLCAVTGWGLELAILVGLFWKYTDVGKTLYTAEVKGPPLFAYIIFGCGVLVSCLIADRTLGQERFRLRLLTGPCVLMAVFLVVMLNWNSGPFVSKDISAAAWEKHVPKAFYEQWLEDYFNRVRSERLTCAIIAASTFLLYANRFSNARRQSKQSLMSCVAEQGEDTPSPIEER